MIYQLQTSHRPSLVFDYYHHPWNHPFFTGKELGTEGRDVLCLNAHCQSVAEVMVALQVFSF